MSIKTVDVSGYNGAIDWRKAYDAGIRFAILKIIRKDLGRDKRFDANMTACNNIGLPWDVYNYSYATTTAKAKSDMNLICDILDKVDKKHFRGVIWFDLEDDCQKKLSKSVIADIVNAAQAVVESRGYAFGVYTGYVFYTAHINRVLYKCDRWWIARYYLGYTRMPVGQTPNAKYKPNVLSLDGWQYTSSGVVPGITGNQVCDLSEYYESLTLKTVLQAPVASAQANSASKKVTDYVQEVVKKMKVLKKGSKGKAVKVWQMILGNVSVDGSFGPDTEAKTKAYQKSNGLTVDGYVGPQTWTAGLKSL